MKTIRQSILGLVQIKDFGAIDFTVAGRISVSTSLSVVLLERQRQLEITLWTRGPMWRHGDTFYWLLDAGNCERIQTDLQTTLVAMRDSKGSEVPLNMFVRSLLWCFGFRLTHQLGRLSLTDGFGRVSGFVAVRKGVPFLVVRRAVTGHIRYVMIPQGAVQVILDRLTQFWNEGANQSVELTVSAARPR